MTITTDTAQAASSLHTHLLDGTLTAWIGQHYDLAADEAAIAAEAASAALRDTWSQTAGGQSFTPWLADVSPALLLLLADGAARTIVNPWAGANQLRTARLSLGLLATDPRLDAR
ncbi:hypothetical protein F4556_005086 [Kitasatospora gansuensis]|uniref:Uncharacterized protein n=1 Tax=Kitasatospora gansuensis TaxID=258050 RepID=A0A7W7SFJ6_9ACTN|nr:hypothetical protein [Kitasatospora gansuensis]MBB4949551.1 hypothetical protein [Kitasatospora gansuensis]